MTAFAQHLRMTLRLYGRNRMALFYSYLFPLIFLISFAVYYRHDTVPLENHLGEILTVAILGGACFGLPTSMVSERERGVWRRYRLAPVPTRTLIASTAVARYFTLITAGLLQVALAILTALWMRWDYAQTKGNSIVEYLPIPDHPLMLLVAFTFVAYAFIGLGLVMATLADNVPAVQALGQCIFLPMLIIGGVAVPINTLGPAVGHISNFFPGIYAVDVLQSSVWPTAIPGDFGFNLLALFLIGTAGCIAGSKMFRWDAHQRFVERGGKRWIAVALAAWVAVGVIAEIRNGGELPERKRPPIESLAPKGPGPKGISTPAPPPNQ